MMIAAIIMGGFALMTLIITVGVVTAQRNARLHEREILILRQQHDLEQKQLRS